MKPRKKIQFKINGKVVVEETNDLYLNQIDEMKWIIASELECRYEDIEVETIELSNEYSDFDVTIDGLMNWKDTQGKIITGVSTQVKFGSSEHLDLIGKLISILDYITLE